ncbi:LysR family transcriptional regulator [Pseudomonas putida]|uniref:LysR family transcriptional regulator n=1 Tax=Pseudomonas putida TaxID=303 RepID=A0AA37VT79_PSEPU|nr:LysR substrate-binding domain-containing protein [Pseudomonas putida]GLO15197.1 LysR family transcriptional regulator [Pseudomonas putida]GLO37292.1 LysR family transcriptional regulator [Pseudomonas putida]HDS0964615.1 LysR family transcriptional regulator [Pseudomonas putida]HDS0990685.1 LysR family transcriptional regulator [Pseudomonas putida]
MKTQENGNTHKGYRRIIPSMTALLEFEAVARHNSFTLAAQELGVTQAAVSKQVRQLEENLGRQLFQRLHRGIRLTSEGQALFTVISESMQKIASVFDRLSDGDSEQELVLSSTATFSQLRVMPRLGRLRSALPQVRLRLATQMFTGDLRNHDVDLLVRFGNGRWEDGIALHLFDEEIFPVCSPAWLARNPLPESLEALYRADLLDADATTEGWMTWPTWFRALGGNPPKLQYNLRCQLYTDTIQGALHGHGVALGWGRMLDHLLASGELVRLTELVVRPREAYYLVVPHGRTTTPTILGLVDWLRDHQPAT